MVYKLAEKASLWPRCFQLELHTAVTCPSPALEPALGGEVNIIWLQWWIEAEFTESQGRGEEHPSPTVPAVSRAVHRLRCQSLCSATLVSPDPSASCTFLESCPQIAAYQLAFTQLLLITVYQGLNMLSPPRTFVLRIWAQGNSVQQWGQGTVGPGGTDLPQRCPQLLWLSGGRVEEVGQEVSWLLFSHC